MEEYQQLGSAAEIRQQGLSLRSYLDLNEIINELDEGETVRTRNSEIIRWCRNHHIRVIHGLFGSWLKKE